MIVSLHYRINNQGKLLGVSLVDPLGSNMAREVGKCSACCYKVLHYLIESRKAAYPPLSNAFAADLQAAVFNTRGNNNTVHLNAHLQSLTLCITSQQIFSRGDGYCILLYDIVARSAVVVLKP